MASAEFPDCKKYSTIQLSPPAMEIVRSFIKTQEVKPQM